VYLTPSESRDYYRRTREYAVANGAAALEDFETVVEAIELGLSRLTFLGMVADSATAQGMSAEEVAQLYVVFTGVWQHIAANADQLPGTSWRW
jgi:hypothetical protein